MPNSQPENPANGEKSDFIRDTVKADLESGLVRTVHTRFPPEPNGFLHIGHTKSICLNFGIAREFGGTCHLRMDDTNPTKEEDLYVQSILKDVHWLIDGWADQCLRVKPRGAEPVASERDFKIETAPASGDTEPLYASDYFHALYTFAVRLIESGKAFVCDLTPGQIEEFRGSTDSPGKPSPFRERTVEENLELFEKMKNGEFPDGAKTLRAKIDVHSPNIWLRDPILYRIRHAKHHHVGETWRIYPMYDFAHCLSDYIEGITHSFCTLEFEVHRPLYNWILESLDLPRSLPRQYEFARLNLNYTVLSKRKLLQLVEEGHVNGWDDPRLPTVSGIRRRGVTAGALRKFASDVGVTKFKSLTDVAVLDHAIREELNQSAERRLAVLHPVKLVLTNLPDGYCEEFDAVNNPEDPEAGTRKIPFGKTIFIDAQDFMEDPPKKFFRLKPGGDVRLKYACIITCDEVIKNSDGNILEIRCTADLDSRRGGPNSDRKVKGTIHWVSADHAIDAEVRLYDRLFNVERPEAESDFTQHLNPDSLTVVSAKCEPSLAGMAPGQRVQFERLGYFTPDPDGTPENPVFNRILPLRDSWARMGGGK